MKWLNIKAIKKITPGVLEGAAAVCWTVEQKKVTLKSSPETRSLVKEKKNVAPSARPKGEPPPEAVSSECQVQKLFLQTTKTATSDKHHRCVNTDNTPPPLFASLPSHGVIVIKMYVIIIRQRGPI